jgi:hypothetical protein
MRRRKRILGDLDRDIREHIAMETQDNIARGMSPEEARRAAFLKFGNLTKVEEETREVWSFVWLEQLLQEVRYGLRMLAKAPGFTTVAVLTLALGIGANTAIFSLMDAVMLRMLPVQNPEQLVQVGMMTHGFGRSPRTIYTNPLWESLRARQDTFAGIFAWGNTQFNLAPRGGTTDRTGRWSRVSGAEPGCASGE